jgi:outer membrane protein OmpA-like peptidoglycan-associated protein
MSEDPISTSADRQRTSWGLRALSALLLTVVLLLLAGVGYVGFRILDRFEVVEEQLAAVVSRTEDAEAISRKAMDRAVVAETAAHAAARAREVAEARAARDREDAEAALDNAEAALDDAARAKARAARAEAEAARIRQQAEKELNRLEEALGQVAETRRTALGLVMSLNSDYLKFEFDKAELRPEDRELLSRIAGILLTSEDYVVSVNGHTDDVGSAEYNQKLSERRAQAVRDYLVGAGLSPDILTVTGHGKELPLVQGTSDEARAKNRRVELGIVNTRIVYGGSELHAQP